MPANEQTWRNPKALHLVFAISSLILLVSTIAMLAVDHRREWKVVQRQFRKLETANAAFRVDELRTSEYQAQLDAKKAAITVARQTTPDARLIDRFVLDLLYHGRIAEGGEPTAAQHDQYAAIRRGEEGADVSGLIASLREGAPTKPVAEEVHAAYTAVVNAEDDQDRARARDELLARMRTTIADVKFRESTLSASTKKLRGKLDEVRANYELAVGADRPQEELDSLQAIVDDQKSRVDEENSRLQAAQLYRQDLENSLKLVVRSEEEAQKDYDKLAAELQLREKTFQERSPNASKRLVELPVLDAFGSPLKIEQIWLPKLTLNNNFRDVARFDRCTTCHLGIDKTRPGSAVDPNYHQAHPLTMSLQAPAEIASKDAEGENARTTDNLYGMRLSEEGIFADGDATVSVVFPNRAAAVAGLLPGDVIQYVNDVKILNQQMAQQYLVDGVKPGETLTLRVRRGVPQPFSTHPRLDLFVSDTSPHPAKSFGCTICHQGQGSATSFMWSSHTPNTPAIGQEWARTHGYAPNHHWLQPMLPSRFEESSCLKCHHQVTELEQSPRFPEPPAPKLIAGYDLIRQYGCFGCHEINGFDGPTRRIGPDLRAEPSFAAVASQLSADPAWKDMPLEVQTWATQVVEHPEDDTARRRLREFLVNDVQAKDLATSNQKLEAMLKDVEAAGQFRKVGPSLRHLASKVDFAFVYDWIRNPRDFRPNTKMPRFFGLWDHLDGKGLADAEAFEPIEIRAATEYLLKNSQPFEYAQPSQQVNVEASVDRGRSAFELRGCLACHQHSDFPKGKAKQGPDLSNIGAKLAHHPEGAPGGAKWLYSWVRNPEKYHPRTLMPNVYLVPVETRDGVTDPAADITAYLMQSRGATVAPNAADPTAPVAGPNTNQAASGQNNAGPAAASGDNIAKEAELAGQLARSSSETVNSGWQPRNIPAPGRFTAEESKAVRALALEHLRDKFPETRAQEYVVNGIPESRRAEIKGDELLLVNLDLNESPEQRLMQYIGRRTISKYGCSGCHDIPGFEDAKPIGTGLADWGRKDPSKLAFEQIGQYLAHHGEGHGSGHGGGHGANQAGGHGANQSASAHGAGAMANAEGDSSQVDAATARQDEAFFLDKILSHEREGFMWQKLRAPRSYDFRKTENKKYNERLRMPKFAFDQQQIEAIMTFVLGLVAEPPASQYVYHPSERQMAIVEGRKVLDKFNCAGCHTLQMDRFDIEYKAEDYEEPAETTDFAFLVPHFTPEQIKASAEKVDHRGMKRATIVGMPLLDERGNLQIVDEDRLPIADAEEGAAAYQPVTLWEPALLNGNTFMVGGKDLLLPLEGRNNRHYPAHGGDLARLIYPTVVAAEAKENKNARTEAWGWLPPPLVNEGRKVQTEWLYSFLLDPYVIRPATVLRMPRFNMSPAEAGTLVNYFAAVDNVDYPYTADQRTRSSYIEGQQERYRQRLEKAGAELDRSHLEDALKIVTSNTYCIKCHKVGDYSPAGNVRALAPNLERVHERLRPNYLFPWLANPKRLLPYTGMPQNISPTQPADQKLYHGTSEEQLVALTDLLMNYDRFIKGNYSIRERYIKNPPAAGAATDATTPPADGATPPANGAAPPANGAATPSDSPAPPGEASAPPDAGAGAAALASPSTGAQTWSRSVKKAGAKTVRVASRK